MEEACVPLVEMKITMTAMKCIPNARYQIQKADQYLWNVALGETIIIVIRFLCISLRYVRTYTTSVKLMAQICAIAAYQLAVCNIHHWHPFS